MPRMNSQDMLEHISKANKPKLEEYFVRSVIKVQIKFALEQATKAQRASRCIALLFP
jgi:hypothetical protein